MNILEQISAKRREIEQGVQNNIQKSFEPDIEKAVYADTAENRKLGRVGQEYHRGKGKKEEDTDIDNFIKVYTSKGGIDYSRYSKYDTSENVTKCIKFLDKQPKIKNNILFRGSYILSGDIVNNIVYGNWKEGETILSGNEIGSSNNNFLSFSKNGNRVFGYTESKPKPKEDYDKFENEPKRVRYSISTKGKNFVDISKKSIYPEEQECLAVKKSSRFKYLGATYHEKGDYWDIKLEEI